MSLPVVLIFDVGKTNKKILLFNRQYECVYEESKQLEESKDEDGFACEDVQLLTAWIIGSFQKLLHDDRFTIIAVNVSAYGASFVHLNDELQPFVPLYNYLKPYPEELLKSFSEKYNKDELLAIQTASPQLRNLNSGMQLYGLKHTEPEVYKQIRYSLHLPQYISFVLGGRLCTDITSVGCHTCLWAFQKNDYHDWVYKEKLTDKFPPIISSTDVTYINNKTIAIGCGLHDSSAALIPYLAAYREPFVLLSTGTWSISLNPFDNTPLTHNDLQHDCLCYLSYKGRRVKASRLFAGNEHEQQIKRLAAYFNMPVDYYKTICYDPSLYSNLNETKSNDPVENNEVMIGESSFGKRNLQQFASYNEAYHQFIHDVIVQQKTSTKRVMENAPVKTIFVDGGFSKNDVYMNLLADAFPHNEVYSAVLPQASALGAAIAIKEAWNPFSLPHNLIELKRFYPSNQAIIKS